MTAINAPRLLSPATRFERLLLGAAARLDRFVAVRVERRATRPAARRIAAPASAADVYARATLLAPIGNQIR